MFTWYWKIGYSHNGELWPASILTSYRFRDYCKCKKLFMLRMHMCGLYKQYFSFRKQSYRNWVLTERWNLQTSESTMQIHCVVCRFSSVQAHKIWSSGNQSILIQILLNECLPAVLWKHRQYTYVLEKNKENRVLCTWHLELLVVFYDHKHIQCVYKWMVQFQKLTRNLFLTLHGQNIHHQQRQLSKFLMHYQQFAFHAYCGAAGSVSKMAPQQEKTFCVLHFEVSRSAITVQREFRAL